MYMYIQCVGNEIARDCVVQGVGGGGGKVCVILGRRHGHVRLIGNRNRRGYAASYRTAELPNVESF